MKTITALVVALLVAGRAFATETTLHGTYGVSAEDLRVRFADAMTLYFKRYGGLVDSDGVGHATYGHDPVIVTLSVVDERHYTLTVSTPKHDSRYTTKWADALRARL